jgi:hypothetical protein
VSLQVTAFTKNTAFNARIKVVCQQQVDSCIQPSLGSNPGMSQPEMEKLGRDDLATDPSAGIAII